MKSFRFHLQRVLDVKEKEKEQAEWAYGHSVQVKQQEEATLYKLVNRREGMAEALVDMQSDSCSAAELLAVTKYQQVVDRQITSQKVKIIGCEKEVQRCQHKLYGHMQETKLWSTLKEKAEIKHQEFQMQLEQKEMDEIGVRRYHRRVNQG